MKRFYMGLNLLYFPILLFCQDIKIENKYAICNCTWNNYSGIIKFNLAIRSWQENGNWRSKAWAHFNLNKSSEYRIYYNGAGSKAIKSIYLSPMLKYDPFNLYTERQLPEIRIDNISDKFLSGIFSIGTNRIDKFSCTQFSEQSEDYNLFKSIHNREKEIVYEYNITSKLNFNVKDKTFSDGYQALLCNAVRSRDTQEIFAMIKKGANPNIGTNYAFRGVDSPLNLAISQQCWECLDAMGNCINFNYTLGTYAELPLAVACRTSPEAVVTLIERYKVQVPEGLLNYVVNSNLIIDGVLPYLLKHYKSGLSLIWEEFLYKIGRAYEDKAYYTFTFEDFIAFVNKGVTIDMKKSGYGMTSVLGFLIEKSMPSYAEFILQKGANPNLCTKYTPLYWAVVKDNMNLVKILLEKGAKPNIGAYTTKDCSEDIDKYKSPLVTAMNKQNPNKEIVKLLLEYGAK